MSTIAWIPFVSPMPSAGALWYLLAVPLVFCVAMVWKAVRLGSMERYWAAVVVMFVQVIVGMIALGLALLILVRLIVPLLPVE
ncbi:MAG: hypothetical protein KF724_00665 [Phycisphaeraceae bacterium]|nr:hypothetical protein [Phycisphaeraceae bacterium]